MRSKVSPRVFLCDLVFDVEGSDHTLPASISPELSLTLACIVSFLFLAPGEKDYLCSANCVTSTREKICKAGAGGTTSIQIRISV